MLKYIALLCVFTALRFGTAQAAPDETLTVPATSSSLKNGTQKIWNLPESAMFFKSVPSGEWYQIPPEEREWILTGGVSPELFNALGPADVAIAAQRGYEEVYAPEQRDAIRKNAIADWRQVLKDEWLPQPGNVTVATLQRRGKLGRSPLPENFAYSAFQGERWRALLLGVAGRSFTFYIEQSDPLPKNVKPVALADVLRSNFMESVKLSDEQKAFPRAELNARELIRYRAFTPGGPYERVRVLLVQVRLPGQLDFNSFGYRLPSSKTAQKPTSNN